ncbi:hypothetical protein PPERSA_12018 [Pseudocohnilembus persalinus]|uniref:Uncharacterized protein n=1 Tax=Pseudocohnilembus persalinus TaxID=266149 RepID=A0A0V0QKG5_PSEPJ|nr:hypothetical protein PPERSA_12018 [Pseudocohnilembus persalinus]|eukprot:KRX02678.1 hypothetical protein PPERSA_12018 [Pseudocohnilembus persalinus]
MNLEQNFNNQGDGQEGMVGTEYFSQVKMFEQEDPVEIFLHKMGRVCFKEVVGKNEKLSDFKDNDFTLGHDEDLLDNDKVQRQGVQISEREKISNMFNYLNKDHKKLINCYQRFIQTYDIVTKILDDDDE